MLPPFSTDSHGPHPNNQIPEEETQIPSLVDQCQSLCNCNLLQIWVSAYHSPWEGGNSSCTYSCFFILCCSVQSFSRILLFRTPWTAACQASLSITNSWSLLKLMSIQSVMPSNHLILCHPRLILPSIFPSIRVSSNESVLHIRWPKYWSFSFSISRSNEYSGLISFRIDWLESLQPKGFSRVFSNTSVEN